jgi:hypothetical protein
MVGVGDTVFITPVNGQKDYIAVITGPAGASGGAGTSGIIEGDYNTWTYKWSMALTDGNCDATPAFCIDEVNDIFYLWWGDNKTHPEQDKMRFGCYNMSDHSVVFESPRDSHYGINTETYNAGYGDYTFWQGCHGIQQSIMRSHQTYMLLNRHADTWFYPTIEIWRAGVLLWSRDVRDDTEEATADLYTTELSLTGKYIMFFDNATMKLWLYEGFDSGTSTGVTETTISDTSKSWSTDVLIGHIIYVTSGGANGQQGTITGNTGTVVTCTAATFVTWGMSVGDTFKVD